jgi:perosamine synthetase
VIPITSVRFGVEEEQLVLESIRSGQVAQGPRVKQFEDEFAAAFGVDHAVAVSNGTIALVAALQILDLQPGDEVITTPFTFVATANAILEAGAVVVFADIEADGFTIDPESVRSRITPRTRAIMPVHLYGQTADMNSLVDIAEQHGLRIIEDAAQAHGASQDSRPIGSFDLATYSFYATKNISTGEGGMVVTNREADADRLRVLRNQGMRARYAYELAGHNYRMTDLQAALGIPQISRYNALVEARSANAARLTEGLQGVPGIITPSVLSGRRHVWHQYTIRIADSLGLTREEFGAELTERGIGNGIYYPKSLTEYDFYQADARVIMSDTPRATEAARQVLSLPVHNALTTSDISAIVSAVSDVARASAQVSL